MNYYYCADGSNVVGPCTLEELAALLAAGTIPATTQVCPIGTEKWTSISVVLPSTAAPPPPPPPPPRTPPPPPRYVPSAQSAQPWQPAQNVPPLPQKGDETGGIIPYKNPQALVAYYLGIFGLIPVFGFFLAVPAFILGILGLKKRKLNPIIKGAAHAWIGIVLGGLSSAIHLAVIGAICWNIAAHKR